MNIFEKKLKGGLKKCPLHRFGAKYEPIQDGWYGCQKCKAYLKMDLVILTSLDDLLKKETVKISRSIYGKHIKFEFNCSVPYVE